MNRSCSYFGIKAAALTLISFSLASATFAACPTTTPEPGCVRFNMLAGSSFNGYTTNTTQAQQQWFQQHFWGIRSSDPFWDTNLPWFPNASLYVESYGIYPTQSLVTSNPNWLMHDGSGNLLYIPYECANGTCPQYAGDFSNPAYRNWWISQNAVHFTDGYNVLWIDDVNLNMTVSDGYGNPVAPIDYNTGAPMTQLAWETYFAQFLQQIRAAFPNASLFHNSLWFAGSGVAGSDPNVQNEVKAANIINFERGFSDPGLTGGTGVYSVASEMNFIDQVHALGTAVEIEPLAFNGNYDLAGYFMIWAPGDMLSNMQITPNNWPVSYDVQLGSPLGPRYNWQGVERRDYSNGVVLMNFPSSPTVTVAPFGTFTDPSGNPLTSVTLSAQQGAILVGAPYFPPAPVAIQINVGGPATQNFGLDEYYSGGNVSVTTHTIDLSGVTNPAPTAVYQDRRCGVQGGTGFSYAVPNLSQGHTYQVRLHFSDPTANAVGQRIFNVTANGITKISNLDIFATAGASNKAFIWSFSIAPNAGNQLILQFQQGSTTLPPMVNAIEILP